MPVRSRACADAMSESAILDHCCVTNRVCAARACAPRAPPASRAPRGATSLESVCWCGRSVRQHARRFGQRYAHYTGHGLSRILYALVSAPPHHHNRAARQAKRWTVSLAGARASASRGGQGKSGSENRGRERAWAVRACLGLGTYYLPTACRGRRRGAGRPGAVPAAQPRRPPPRPPPASGRCDAAESLPQAARLYTGRDV